MLAARLAARSVGEWQAPIGQHHGDRRVSGTAATIPMLPTMARTNSTATLSIDAVRSGLWRPAANRTISGSDAPT